MDSVSIDGARSGTSTLSRAEKALVKRNVYRPHLNRDENIARSPTTTVPKPPKHTPKGYIFWALVFALCIIAICNLLLTITIFSVLRLTKSMESIEIVPTSNLVKFFGEIEVDKVIKWDGEISGFAESPIEIDSFGSGLMLKVMNEHDPIISPLLDISLNSVEFQNIERFDIFEPKKTVKTSAFSTMFPNFGLPKGVQNLHIQKASASRIVSPLESTLSAQSSSQIRLKGNEGITIQGKELLFLADQDLLLRSINGSIILDGKDGIILDIDSLPTVSMNSNNPQLIPQYKLCICLPQGILFRIAVLSETNNIHCDDIDISNDDSICF
nr:EOG090X0F7H [Cyclestheria hislopi]